MSTRFRIADGLRVLELGSGIAGALAGTHLSDAGAEGIRVEPAGGDALAGHPAFRLWTRGRTRVLADLEQRADRERVTRLADEADVLLASWRPGTAERFGLDAVSLCRRNPRLVHCAITGFGPKGPLAGLPAWEGVVAARAGRMLEFSALTPERRPAYTAVPVATYCASQLALHGTFAALLQRERTGEGQRVETSLVQALTVYDLVNWLPGSLMTLRHEDVPYLPYLTGCTRDGTWLQFAQLSPRQFEAFLRTLGLESIREEEERFRRAPGLASPDDLRALRDVFLARLREKTWAEWKAIFGSDPDLAVAPFQTAAQAMQHPQLIHSGDVIQREDARLGRWRELGPLVRFADTPARPGPPAPPPIPVADAHWSERRPGVLGREGGAPSRGGTTGRRREGAPPSRPSEPPRPLDGLLVLELATWVATPLAATLLADLGARVVKLEPPGGEPFRQVAYGRPWLKTIQGKQSLAIDLKRPEAREVLRRLVSRADVLVHNYRPGVPAHLGIDYESVRAWNPRLVYLYGASYGSTGPCSARPAYHPTAGALCGGALAQAGAGSIPPRDAPLDAGALRRLSRRLELANETNPDPTAGAASATALLMALYHRERTGQGQYVETSMLCSNAWALSADFVDWDGRPAREAPDEELLGLGPRYRLYPTAEGWVFLACPTAHGFERFARAVGREDWLRDARLDDAGLASQIEALLAARPAVEWEALLAPQGVGCVVADAGPFARFAYTQPWMREAGFVVDLEDTAVGPYTRFGPTVRLSRDRGELGGPSLAGQQTRAILGELGYGEPEIDSLGASGVVSLGLPA